MTINLRTYTPKFCTEAVKLVLGQALSLEVAAQRLSIPKGTLSNWYMAATCVSKAQASARGSSVAELEDEAVRLRKELAIDWMEKEGYYVPIPVGRLHAS
jgi:transposase